MVKYHELHMEMALQVVKALCAKNHSVTDIRLGRDGSNHYLFVDNIELEISTCPVLVTHSIKQSGNRYKVLVAGQSFPSVKGSFDTKIDAIVICIEEYVGQKLAERKKEDAKQSVVRQVAAAFPGSRPTLETVALPGRFGAFLKCGSMGSKLELSIPNEDLMGVLLKLQNAGILGGTPNPEGK